MALAPVVLDDLDFKAMVEAIRRRIPAASDGVWTLHAPVDPGVTLLELFAWQLEQRLYRMDQVPQALSRSLLALMDAKPLSTQCAQTVLELHGDGGTTVPRRTAFGLDGADPALVYTTRTAATLLQLAAPWRLWIGGRERSGDLGQGRVLRLLPQGEADAATRIELPLGAAPQPGGWFGLWLHLRTPETIAPQWSPDAAPDVAPPTAVQWCYRATDRRLHPFTVGDGTGGLRRGGMVRFQIPPDWAPEPGTQVYTLHLHANPGAYSAPPRIAALALNAVLARHARASGWQGTRADWLPLAGNAVQLDKDLAGDGDRGLPPLESGCVLYLKERDGRWHRWRPAASLHAAGPGTRAFVVDRARALLQFGDGLRGRLPVLAKDSGDTIRFHYWIGGGRAGATGPSPGGDRDWKSVQHGTARNLVASAGGAEAEALQQARERAAAGLALPTRAVTRLDFETIARGTPGVAVRRAHAAIGRHPQQPCMTVPGAVTVFIVPDVPREDVDAELVEPAFVAAPKPDAGMLAAVQARLERARLVGTELFVSAPAYRAIRLEAVLEGDLHAASSLQEQVQQHMRRYLDPLQGGDEGTGWPFGEPVRVSVMLREIQQAVGRQARVANVAVGIDDNAPAESCRAVAIAPEELVWLQDLALRFVPAAGTQGGLR
jgi:hypothetical protein